MNRTSVFRGRYESIFAFTGSRSLAGLIAYIVGPIVTVVIAGVLIHAFATSTFRWHLHGVLAGTMTCGFLLDWRDRRRAPQRSVRSTDIGAHRQEPPGSTPPWFGDD